jgi:hypothetical protein
MYEVEELTDKVLDFLADPASTGVMFDIDEHPTRRIHPDKLSHELREWTYIHPEKLPYRIRSELERGLNDDGWFQLAPRFANFYMTVLASQLAQRLGLGLVTESCAADRLAIAVRAGKPLAGSFARRGDHRFDARGPRRSLPTDVAPSLLFELMVQGVSLPERLSVKEILRFKKDHREELAVFRREVAGLTTDLPKNVPIEALRQAVSDQYEANVLPAMRSLRESLRAASWDAGLNGLLKASFFSAAPTSAAILAGIPGSVALVAGAGISITASAVLLVNQRRRARIESPYSYLLSMQREWGAAG